jgi:proteasome lid subunit RPN8/RPN11
MLFINISNIHTIRYLQSSKRFRKSTIEKNIQTELTSPDVDPHSLVQPYAYGAISADLSDTGSRKQPFEVFVHPQVCLVCDFHSHLCSHEIIGLLAGSWSAHSNTLYIQVAVPCTSTERTEENGGTDVEMDPLSELAARDVISAKGLQVVGWYHSHPRFRPDPSITDIRNQRQHQTLANDIGGSSSSLAGHSVKEEGHCCDVSSSNTNSNMPFVGLIISTFDAEVDEFASVHQWFNVVPFSSNPKNAYGMNVGNSSDVWLPMQVNVHVAKYNHVALDWKCCDVDQINARIDSIQQLLQIDQGDHDVAIPKVEGIHTVGFVGAGGDKSLDRDNKEAVGGNAVDEPRKSGRACKAKAFEGELIYNTVLAGGAVHQWKHRMEKLKPKPSSAPLTVKMSSISGKPSKKSKKDVEPTIPLKKRGRKRKNVEGAVDQIASAVELLNNVKSDVKNPKNKKTVTKSAKSSLSKEVPQSQGNDVLEKKSKKKSKVESESRLRDRIIHLSHCLKHDPAYPCSELACSLACTACPILKLSIINIIALTFYYSFHKHRTSLHQKWKSKSRIAKIIASLSIWLKYFNLEASQENGMLERITSLLNACWMSHNNR